MGATFNVPVGASIQIEASLGVLAGLTNNTGVPVADASTGLTFDPNAYFGLEPGVTANDGEFIVDNQLPGATAVIPEPSSFVLLGIGMTGLCGYGWRKRRKRQAAACYATMGG